MLTYLMIAASLVAAENYETTFKGVDRSELVAYLKGPGAEIGKRRAVDSIETHENALKATRNAVIDRRVDKIQFATSKEGRISVRAQSRDIRDAAVKVAERSLDAAKAQAASPEPFIPRLGVYHLAVGKIGRLRESVGHTPREQDGQSFRVEQVIGPRECVATLKRNGTGSERETIWLEEPTGGMVDGKTYATQDAIYEVVGTKTYTTAIGGSKTVFHLRRVTLDELRGAK